ncbi:MAG: hypothetical protein JNK58_01235 [Phycisphaerae bacterium]|nr:hypothetical protein [Phycisphaerae bacterium]
MAAANGRSWLVIAIVLGVVMAALVLRPDQAIGAERGASGDLGVHVIRGKLTVELILDPATGPNNSTAWTGPIKNVDEVVLFDKWALLRKRDLGTDGTLIVPREKIVFINIGH